MQIELQGSHDLQEQLKKLDKRLGNLSPVFAEIGNTVLNDIDERFEKQGPGWKRLSYATLIGGYRGKKITSDGKATKGFENHVKSKGILHRSGHLRNSFTMDADGSGVTVGTNVEYAAIHNFGGYAGKGRRVKIPARPFMPADAAGNISGDLKRSIAHSLREFIDDS